MLQFLRDADRGPGQLLSLPVSSGEQLPWNRSRTPCAEKNDRLGWTHGSVVRWSGITIGLRCNRKEVLPILQAALPPDSVPCQGRDCDLLLSVLQGGEAGRGRKNYHIVYNGWERVARTHDWDEALEAFRATLHAYRALLAQEHTLVNCLQVELGGRQVLVCPGAEAFPQTEPWVDLRRGPRLVLVVDDRIEDFSERLSPGQVALQLLRYTAPTWTQPQRVVAEVAGLASEMQLYRVPAHQSREGYEAFVSALPRA